MDQSTTPSTRTVLSWLVLTTFLWGGSFVFNKIGLREVPPVAFLVLRFSVATAIMLVVCLRRLQLLTSAIIRKGVILGLALSAANLTFVLGVNGTTISRAGFLNNLFVLIVPLLCFFVWGASIDKGALLGIGFALVGIVELARGSATGFNGGDLLSSVCAFFISLHILAVSHFLRDEDVFLVTLVQFATVAVVGSLIALLSGTHFPVTVSPPSMGALLYCAVFPTVICFTLQNSYQRYTTPVQAGLIYTLDPVWSMLGGMILLGERLTLREWAGCGLIFAGVILPIVLRMKERKKGEEAALVAQDGA